MSYGIVITSHAHQPHQPQTCIRAVDSHTHTLLHVSDLDLDGTSLGVSRGLESLDGLLNGEAVGNEGLQVDQTSINKSDSAAPGVAVSVLVLQINLHSRETHEGNLDLVLAAAGNEDLAAEGSTPDGGVNAGLDTSALESDLGAEGVGVGAVAVVDDVEDVGSAVLGGLAAGDEVSEDIGVESLSESETALVDIGNDAGGGASGLEAEQGDETNGTGTHDQGAVTQSETGALNSSQGNGEGLKHGTLLVGHVVAHLEAELGLVDQVAAQQSGDGGSGEESNVGASVVATSKAGLAGVANLLGLNGDAVADLDVLDVRADSDNVTSGLVAEDVVAGDDHGADAASVPEVNVRAEYTC